MSASVTPGVQIAPPLATDATTATRAIGACHLCQRGITRGERYGRIFPSGRIAHVACVAAEALAPARGAA